MQKELQQQLQKLYPNFPAISQSSLIQKQKKVNKNCSLTSASLVVQKLYHTCQTSTLYISPQL